jgi:hypothetical protein
VATTLFPALVVTLVQIGVLLGARTRVVRQTATRLGRLG